MQEQTVEVNGRKYRAIVSPDMPAGAYIIVGPPEGLVDELDLPESVATNLHNILFDRGIFTAKEASRNGVLRGVVQELYQLETQRLYEKFLNFEKETV